MYYTHIVAGYAERCRLAGRTGRTFRPCHTRRTGRPANCVAGRALHATLALDTSIAPEICSKFAVMFVNYEAF